MVRLDVNTEKTVYVLTSCHHNAGQNCNMKITSRSIENVAKFTYLATTVRNQNLIQKESKRRLSPGNAWYRSFQNLLSSRLLSENVKIKVCKTIILL
jgi:hypothetical protein